MHEGGDKSQGGDVSQNQNKSMDRTPPKGDQRVNTQNTEAQPMRSTAAETHAFRSQYAQQREREASGSNYRDQYVRDTQVNGFAREFYEKENRYPSPPRYE